MKVTKMNGMKWFKVDSDAPSHPTNRRVLKELGTEGFGGLILLWCFIAQFGRDLPGRGVDGDGDPIPKDVLVDVSTLSEEKFEKLVEILYQCKAIDRDAWAERQELYLRGMRSRGDAYAKRLGLKSTALNPERPSLEPLTQVTPAAPVKSPPVDPDKQGGKETAQRLADAWNHEAGTVLQKVRKVTNRRVSLCTRAVKAHGIAALEHAITMVPTVPFLTGSKGWTASFDWLMTGDNSVKVNEGQYEEREGGGSSRGLFIDNREALDAFVKEGMATFPSPAALLGDD